MVVVRVGLWVELRVCLLGFEANWLLYALDEAFPVELFYDDSSAVIVLTMLAAVRRSCKARLMLGQGPSSKVGQTAWGRANRRLAEQQQTSVYLLPEQT